MASSNSLRIFLLAGCIICSLTISAPTSSAILPDSSMICASKDLLLSVSPYIPVSLSITAALYSSFNCQSLGLRPPSSTYTSFTSKTCLSPVL
ncbi:MAG: hypothetical protein K6G84_12860, partial [Lachnospiraceae bacterium]|nr:hypothetical protein [Lachnospiraceae bacterium]